MLALTLLMGVTFLVIGFMAKIAGGFVKVMRKLDRDPTNDKKKPLSVLGIKLSTICFTLAITCFLLAAVRFFRI